jgi:hypothetical protein
MQSCSNRETYLKNERLYELSGPAIILLKKVFTALPGKEEFVTNQPCPSHSL